MRDYTQLEWLCGWQHHSLAFNRASNHTHTLLHDTMQSPLLWCSSIAQPPHTHTTANTANRHHSPNTLHTLTHTTQVDADLKTVPGVGPKAKELLEAAGVENTYQLIGKFLTLKGSKLTTQQHCDAFYEWIVEVGIRAHR